MQAYRKTEKQQKQAFDEIQEKHLEENENCQDALFILGNVHNSVKKASILGQ